MERIKPNFLIVGAARSGTTSLYDWLKQNPDVFLPNLKEPCYFVYGHGISNWDDYLSLFEPARSKKAIGEASVQYLDAEESPSWIHQVLGDVKIVILLRNPIERAFSLYSLSVMRGTEWIPSFEKALAEEESRFQDESFHHRELSTYFRHFFYFRGGLYYEQVKRYLDTFGSEFVRVYLFEDLANSPDKTYNDVCNFIGVSHEVRPVFTHQNRSGVPRSIKLQYLLYSLERSPRRLPGILRFVNHQLICLNIRVGPKTVIPQAVKKVLQEKYRTDIVRLAELIHRDLSLWLS